MPISRDLQRLVPGVDKEATRSSDQRRAEHANEVQAEESAAHANANEVKELKEQVASTRKANEVGQDSDAAATQGNVIAGFALELREQHAAEVKRAQAEEEHLRAELQTMQAFHAQEEKQREDDISKSSGHAAELAAEMGRLRSECKEEVSRGETAASKSKKDLAELRSELQHWRQEHIAELARREERTLEASKREDELTESLQVLYSLRQEHASWEAAQETAEESAVKLAAEEKRWTMEHAQEVRHSEQSSTHATRQVAALKEQCEKLQQECDDEAKAWNAEAAKAAEAVEESVQLKQELEKQRLHCAAEVENCQSVTAATHDQLSSFRNKIEEFRDELAEEVKRREHSISRASETERALHAEAECLRKEYSDEVEHRRTAAAVASNELRRMRDEGEKLRSMHTEEVEGRRREATKAGELQANLKLEVERLSQVIINKAKHAQTAPMSLNVPKPSWKRRSRLRMS
jgi:hypothetical protein